MNSLRILDGVGCHSTKKGKVAEIKKLDTKTTIRLELIAGGIKNFNIKDYEIEAKIGNNAGFIPLDILESVEGQQVTLSFPQETVEKLVPGNYFIELWLVDKQTNELALFPSSGFLNVSINANITGIEIDEVNTSKLS